MTRNARTGLVLAAVLVLAPAIAWTIWNVRAGAHLRRVLAEIRAKGWPMTVAEFRSPAAPDADNAAPLLNRAFLIMAGGRAGLSPLAPAFQELSDLWGGETNIVDRLHADPSLATDVVSKLSQEEVGEAVRLLRAAAARRTCDFELRYEDGPGLLLPHLTPMRTAVRLVCLRSWMAARDGDPGEAVTLAREALTLSGMAADDGTLVGFLVSLAGLRTVLEALPRILALLPPDLAAKTDIAALAADIARRRDALRPALRRSIDGERVCLGGWIFERVLSGQISSRDLAALSPADTSRRWLPWPAAALKPLFKADYAFYLSALSDFRDAVESRGEPRSRGHATHRHEAPPRWAILSRLALPSFDRVVERTALTEHWLDIASLGLALERYRAERGAYPASLEDLHPHGGKPDLRSASVRIRYERRDGGVVLAAESDGDGADGKAVRGVRSAGDEYVWNLRRPPTRDAER